MVQLVPALPVGDGRRILSEKQADSANKIEGSLEALGNQSQFLIENLGESVPARPVDFLALSALDEFDGNKEIPEV